MKLFVVFYIVCSAITLANSASMTSAKLESNECEAVALQPNYYNLEEGEGRTKKANEESSCTGNTEKDRSECVDGIEDAPSLTSFQQPELEILENTPMQPNYFFGLRPSQWYSNWNAPWQKIEYQSNYLPGLTSIPYGGQYYAHPQLFTPFNPSPSYLPPAVPPYARRSIPELHRQVYGRPTRVIRSREEDDFMAELQHMAMMNNILPTMSIPFVRSSHSDYVPYGASGAGGATVVFPVSPSGCALPLLFSCSPKITRGVVAKPLPADYSQYVSSPALSDGYRKQELKKEDTAELKSGVSQSDAISGNGLELSDDVYDGIDKKEPTMNAIDRALQPKHVGAEKHVTSDRAHVNGVPGAHMTS